MSDIPKWDDTEDLQGTAIAASVENVPKFEDTAPPSFDDTEEIAATEEESPILNTIANATGTAENTVKGGAIGLGTGIAAKELIERGGRAAINVVGDLSADQIDKIGDNRDIYKKAPALESLMEEWRNLGVKNREVGMQAAEDARKALEGKPRIPVKEYYSALGDTVKNDKFTEVLPEGKLEQILAQQLDQIKPNIDAERERILALDNELAEVDQNIKAPPVDERLAINQQFKDAKFQNRLEKATPVEGPGRADQIGNAQDTFKIKKETRQLQRIDERIAKVEEKMAQAEMPQLYNDKLENIQKRKEDFIYNQANSKEKAGTVKGARDAKSLEVAENRKAQMTFNKILDDEKTAQLSALKQREKYEKLLEQKAKLEADKKKAQLKIEEKVNSAKSAADGEMDNIRRTPKQIVETDANYFGNRQLGTPYAQSLGKAVDEVKDLEEVSPVRLDQIKRELQENDINYDQSGVVNNQRKAMARSLGDKIAEKFPEYKPGMEKSAKSFDIEELLKKVGVKYNKDLDQVVLEDGGKQKINRILLDPKRYSQEYEYLQGALNELKANDVLPANADINQMLQMQETSALKNEVQRLRDGKSLNTHDFNAVSTGNLKNVPGTIGKFGGTRVQELYGLYKDSMPMKGVKNLVKNAPGILGVSGAIMGATAAAEAGELSPGEAVAAGAAESLNPVPFTDVIAGAVEGKKAFNETGSVIEGVKAGAEAYAKPAVDGLNKFGSDKSDYARKRIEGNFNALDTLNKKAPHEDFKTFVEQKPEMIQDLAEMFKQDESTTIFAAPLEKAANADDRTRSAVLFGLYQQPAFRQAMKGKTK